MDKHKVFVIIGSTRPGRIGAKMANWVKSLNSPDSNLDLEIVDLAEINLPLLDEPMPAMMGQYSGEHTKVWAAKVAQAEGFIFVTPEYNAGYPAALKNAIDYLFNEWAIKKALIVSYGYGGGVRAQVQLVPVLNNVKLSQVEPAGSVILSQEMFNDIHAGKDLSVVLEKEASDIKASLSALEAAFNV